MRRYFYGVKVQVLATAKGIPVEFCFVPGSESDVQALKKLPLSVVPESSIYGDAAYTDYGIEDNMSEAENIHLRISRKSDSKRKDELWMRFLKENSRKRIETTFSEIKNLFLRKIHAVTFKGFLLKIWQIRLVHLCHQNQRFAVFNFIPIFLFSKHLNNLTKPGINQHSIQNCILINLTNMQF